MLARHHKNHREKEVGILCWCSRMWHKQEGKASLAAVNGVGKGKEKLSGKLKCLLVWLIVMATQRNIRYSPLSAEERDDNVQEEDLRFSYNPRALDRVPWKSIALALFLLSLGSLLLFLSFFIFTGHMGGEKSQAYGLLVLGILAFLPGFYETRMAYYSWRGAPGYRFSAIPTY